MSKYVDGFVIPVPKGRLEAYRKMADASGKIWMEYGALQFMECVGDDLDIKDMPGFPAMVKARPDETVVFSWIVYASRKQRDEINAKIMEDPRMQALCTEENMPFDCQRMSYGGFRSIVEYGEPNPKEPKK
jgi:uncharacterized protein YbaA (DUF1428 family)